MITASNVKIDSMILHILHEYNFNPLIVLFNDYLKKKYSKKAFLLIRILLKAYVIKNIYKDKAILYNYYDLDMPDTGWLNFCVERRCIF